MAWTIKNKTTGEKLKNKDCNFFWKSDFVNRPQLFYVSPDQQVLRLLTSLSKYYSETTKKSNNPVIGKYCVFLNIPFMYQTKLHMAWTLKNKTTGEER